VCGIRMTSLKVRVAQSASTALRRRLPLLFRKQSGPRGISFPRAVEFPGRRKTGPALPCLSSPAGITYSPSPGVTGIRRSGLTLSQVLGFCQAMRQGEPRAATIGGNLATWRFSNWERPRVVSRETSTGELGLRRRTQFECDRTQYGYTRYYAGSGWGPVWRDGD
jgi:hypothetical protein